MCHPLPRPQGILPDVMKRGKSEKGSEREKNMKESAKRKQYEKMEVTPKCQICTKGQE